MPRGSSWSVVLWLVHNFLTIAAMNVSENRNAARALIMHQVLWQVDSQRQNTNDENVSPPDGSDYNCHSA